MIGANRLLVVGPSWVGDMVMAQPLLRLLRERDPDCRIDLVAPPASLPLAAFMAEIDEAIALPVPHGRLALRERYRLARRLRARRYARAIVLPRSFKSALLPFWARVPVRTGYRGGEMRWWLLTDARRLPRRPPPEIEKFAALALPPGMPLPPLEPPRFAVSEAVIEAALRSQALQRPVQPLLILAPGAEFGPAKRWPAAHFAVLAQAKIRDGWAVWLLGAAGDRDAAAVVREACPAAVDLAGRTTLAEAVALIAIANAVVSNDSGLMHVAAALERPQVALFGPSDAERTGPRNARARVIARDLSCRPCHSRVCPLGHHACLAGIAPQQVLEAMAGL